MNSPPRRTENQGSYRRQIIIDLYAVQMQTLFLGQSKAPPPSHMPHVLPLRVQKMFLTLTALSPKIYYPLLEFAGLDLGLGLELCEILWNIILAS